MTDPASRRNRAIWRALAAALVLAPPAFLAPLIVKYSVNVPLWDQWEPDIAGMFEKHAAGRLTLADLLAQHNEARLFFPRLFMLMLGKLTHWNVRYEMAATFLAACLVGWMIWRLQAPAFRGRPGVRLGVLFLSSLLIFSPAYYEAWLWGLEFICFVPLACITASLLVARLQFSPAMRLAACAALSTVSTYSFGNGFLAWIVLFPALFRRDGPGKFQHNGWAAGMWAAGFAASEALYFYGYQKPPQHRPFLDLWLGCVEQPLRTAQFFFSFFGGPLAGGTGHPQASAAIIGFLLFALFLGAGVWILRLSADRELVAQTGPWLAIGGYAVLSAALATSTRATQFGAEQALSSRYGIFAMALAVSVIHLSPLLAFRWLERRGGPPRERGRVLGALALAAAALCVLHALAFPAGAWAMRSTWSYRVLGKSCLAFVNVIPLQREINELLAPDYDNFKRMVRSLERLGLLVPPPFAVHPTNLFRCQPQSSEESLGRLETSRRISETQLLLLGWAVSPSRQREADAVLLTWEREGGEPRLFGLMGDRVPRADLGILLGTEPYFYSGWQMVCSLTNLPKESLVLRAWTYDAERQKAFPLDGAEALDNR